MTRALIGAALLVSACSAGVHTRAGGAVSPLVVQRVDWTGVKAPLGNVRAVADTGNVVAVLGDQGASVFTAGALANRDPRKADWLSAAVIPGADRSARWIVGIDAQGRIHYLHNQSVFEDVSSRYGLAGDRVRGAVPLGGALAGFLLEGQLAIANGQTLTRYRTLPFAELSGGDGSLVGVANGAIDVFRARDGAVTEYRLPGVLHAVVASDSRLYASTSRALYVTNRSSELSLLYLADADSLHGLVVSGGHVWFADGGELGLVDGDHVKETTGALLPVDATLAPSPTGDVWVLGRGALSRYRSASGAPRDDAAWMTVAPVFARACARCHLADGISGIDLSTATAWDANRAAIRDRVVEAKTMPPRGNALGDADRDVVRAWVASTEK
jgi:mono/diheme cytochrome c family protein